MIKLAQLDIKLASTVSQQDSFCLSEPGIFVLVWIRSVFLKLQCGMKPVESSINPV